ncbi:DNA-binding transcriptional regulator of sugar metabolism, DeoR/GlpR family [Paenibacillus catalpae]|uniref:DNA-binding transcriptional regulator of sugar metabolism, DeoR/GlpR family n=1 Tax=Paenibacillus catalpae TaxID=1045775 RepID=A0A1I1XFV1_9BACL|nr:DeoR/GlpR family DNA-binding transcription regulator [Paenibacillus catalpae]SFE06256.1 DNA-binding transcriptional regulator of sugar metabolism, DeoR/GlpR family [Paenibacillus catalpae]
MTQEERIQSIVDYLKRNHNISMEDICTKYEVSYDTARRDLVRMESDGLIVRVRGGAILPSMTKQISSYKERLTDAGSKRSIALAATSLIQSGDYLMLDTGTTTQYIAEFMPSQDNVVVTNSIDIAAILCDKPQTRTHMLGGELHAWHRYAFGPRTIEMLSDIRVDKLFLGTCGITAEGLFAPTVEEAYLKREMIKRANQVILLADSSKFEKTLFHRVCPFDDIDVLITDAELPVPFGKICTEYDIKVIVAAG